ncbi:MAG: DUF2117 domain-containing protein [Methanobacterium sp.]|uniref:DUF2117 domain-containing protein n=1 Tax=Methanobacterium sp. TaxID=2164 RepID=UPI003D645EF2|nr:DUF2117 domain-containing protein [Methanobacterium sp.]
MKIGVVVHGPYIVDSGYAEKILNLLGDYGEVSARLGGTMGRTAVHDAHLEDRIDISQKLLPSESVDKFTPECDVIFLINYGKSSVTGHAFGFKVFNHCKSKPPLIQIERPGESDGSIISWDNSLNKLAEDISEILNLKIVSPLEIEEQMAFNKVTKTERSIAGVSSNENIFVNGIVVGKSTSSEVILVAENGLITKIIGGDLKEHGVKKLGKIDLQKAIIKTGLLRRSEITPRVLKSCRNSHNFCVAFLDHAAEDIYKLKDVDMVVTVGDDTTLVAGDILYRFNVPIIGITDGDIDKVVEKGFKASESLIIELENGLDDVIGKKIFHELFNEEEIIEIENIENFKNEILQIINHTSTYYKIKEN